MRRYKLSVLGWVVLYPVITALIYATEPVIGSLPTPVQTLVLTALAVPLMDYAAMPLAIRFTKKWLTR